MPESTVLSRSLKRSLIVSCISHSGRGSATDGRDNNTKLIWYFLKGIVQIQKRLMKRKITRVTNWNDDNRLKRWVTDARSVEFITEHVLMIYPLGNARKFVFLVSKGIRTDMYEPKFLLKRRSLRCAGIQHIDPFKKRKSWTKLTPQHYRMTSSIWPVSNG